MATEFNAQTGGGKYRIQFETDNAEYFMLMQELARCCVDHQPIKTNADRIRAMTVEELADVVVCPHTGNWDLCRDDCKPCRLEWLRQPAEVHND